MRPFTDVKYHLSHSTLFYVGSSEIFHVYKLPQKAEEIIKEKAFEET
jgi:hypothetical protein